MSVWRVLLVDDSALIRSAMQVALEPYGLELGHAENGAIAVERALSARWDLIFLDVVMPVMDGPTALRRIRAHGNATPVVLVTSVSTAAVVASALKLGGVSYIGKPFTPEQIRAVAARMLKLDAGVLGNPPRVLLQHTDPALPTQLRRLLPGHVVVDASPTLAHTLDLAEAGRRDLVLFESRELGDEQVSIANLIRRALPAAGIFAMTDTADPAAPWQPDPARRRPAGGGFLRDARPRRSRRAVAARRGARRGGAAHARRRRGPRLPVRQLPAPAGRARRRDRPRLGVPRPARSPAGLPRGADPHAGRSLHRARPDARSADRSDPDAGRRRRGHRGARGGQSRPARGRRGTGVPPRPGDARRGELPVARGGSTARLTFIASQDPESGLAVSKCPTLEFISQGGR